VFSGTEVGFSTASTTNTAPHKPASPAARYACCFREKRSKKLAKSKKISVNPKFSPCSHNRAHFALNQLLFSVFVFFLMNYFSN
jgi:hypothetical protein